MNQLTELRNIIVGQEQQELLQLKKRLEENKIDPKRLAEMLPQVLELTTNSQGEFSQPIQEFMAKSTLRSVKEDPQGFAEVMYPALVPAIRLMIVNSVRSLTRRLNTVIESTTTIQGLKWRFEAFRKGEAYSQVVMRKTLQYRVEQLYLIKSDSGVLIEHLVNENIGTIDSDAIAAMLSAIQSFVKDSFQSPEGDNLNQITVGDLNVWLVHSPNATLACVVRGTIPYHLRDQLESAQDSIFSKFSQKINEFKGHEGSILGIREILEPCLQLKFKEGRKTKKFPIASLLICLTIFLALFYWTFHELNKTKMQNNVESLLFVTPGILPINVEWKGGRLKVIGLKDPEAEVPWEKLKEYGVEVDNVDFSLKSLESINP